MLSRFPEQIEQFILEPGSGGAFELFRDGEKVYSKLETGRFPGEDEVVRALRREDASPREGDGP